MPKAMTRIGFLSGSPRRRRYYDHFQEMAPEGVVIEFQPLALWQESLTELAGAAERHIAKAKELAKERQWHGIGLLGAPMEAQNPGFLADYRAALDIPVTSAMDSAVQALKSLGLRRVLLLTPFDVPMNQLLRRHLADAGVEALIPESGFAHVAEAERLEPEQVYSLAVDAFNKAHGAEGIYFQGGPLNPIEIIDTLEEDLAVPVVASNPSILWRLLSMLGQQYSIAGLGRLLREWPSPVV